MENTENTETKAEAKTEDDVKKIEATRKRLNNMVSEIRDWNEQQFPDATLDGQLMKLEEELKEFHHAEGKDRLKEIADIVIVCAGLRRWQSFVGFHILATVVNGAPQELVNELLDAVDEKMAKNRARVWLKDGDGKYHHDVKLDEPANGNGEDTPA